MYKYEYVIAMYKLMEKHIVDRVSIFAGRTMESINNCFGESPVSSLERSLRFPVSLRKRSVLRLRITEADVSRMSASEIRAIAPP